MKKVICIMIAITMLMCSSVSAFALNNESSTFGAAKFEEYLKTLDPDRAALIRADKELVYTMTRDAYWMPQNTPQNHTAVSLPLSGDYAPGRFYNTFGTSPCTCHEDCTYVGIINEKCNLNGVAGNCKAYRGAIQCKAFADDVFHQYTGNDVSNQNAVSDDLIPKAIGNNAVGRDEMHAFMRGLSKGTNIRFAKRNATNSYHSIILLGSSTTGITLYDCNGTNKSCEIRTTTMTWADLVTRYSGITGAWEP